MNRIRRMAWLAAGAGLAVFLALLALQGWDDVAAALAHGGWPLLLVVPVRVATLALDTRAWRALLERSDPDGDAGPLFLLWVAAIREAVNRLLPVAGVGGDVAGIRLVCARVADRAGVVASVVVEVLLTIGVLTVFCAAGVLLMARIAAGMPQVGLIALCLSLSLPLPVLAWWLLRRGAPFAWLERSVRRLAGSDDAGNGDGAAVDAAIRSLFGQRRRLARACGWSLLSYVLGAFETWYVLRVLGHPVPVDAAVAIEALTQATRHAGFLVPAGLGVQEAATLLFGHLAGVGGGTALALALVKRMREVVLGVPALASWHWAELRRFRAGGYAPPGT